MRLLNRLPLIIWGDIVDGDENVLCEEVVPDDAAGHLPLVVRHVDGLPGLQVHAGHAAESRPHHVLLHEVKEASGLLEAHGIPAAKFQTSHTMFGSLCVPYLSYPAPQYPTNPVKFNSSHLHSPYDSAMKEGCMNPALA